MCVYISYPSTILAIKLSDSTRWETAELEEACYPIGFQLIDESEDSRGCAPWETGHTPLLPLAVGGLRPPGHGWSIEGCGLVWGSLGSGAGVGIPRERCRCGDP